MRIKELFTVREDEKVTEKVFGRVLVSSLCSILLCMVCLVSTTWAWFSVSVENTNNIIEIATVTPTVTVSQGGNQVAPNANGGYDLAEGTYSVHIKLESNATDAMRSIYMVLSVTQGNDTAYHCIAFENGDRETTKELAITGDAVSASFAVSWVKPDDADPAGDRIAAGVANDAEPGDGASEPSAEATTEATTTPATEPSAKPTTEPTTEATTTPATEATGGEG